MALIVERNINPRFLLVILTGLNLLNYFDRFILASLLETIRVKFTLSDAEAGTLSTAFIFGYFLTSPFFGYLGDRYSRKWLIAGGILVWSAATVMTGYASSYYELILYRILVGVGEASYATCSPALISDAFPAARRNNALTIFYVAIPLGAAFGTLFGSWAGTHYGWEYAFIWAGLPGLFLAFLLLPFKEPEREGSGPSHAPPKLKDLLNLIRIKEFQLVIWGYVAFTFALGAYQYWGQAFMQRIYNVEQQAAGQFFGGVMVLTGIFGTFFGGWVATKAQRKNPGGYAYTIGLAVLTAVPLTLVFTFAESTFLFKASLTLTMFFLFIPTGPVNTLILETVPANLRASAMALSIFAIHAFGDLWSPYLVGKVSDMSGSLRTGIFILSPALLICAVLWLWLGRLSNNKKKALREPG